MCRWERVLFEGTKDQVLLKKDIDQLRGKLLRGDPVGPILRKREQKRRQI